jgi:hemerythrin-like metal-binding protein
MPIIKWTEDLEIGVQNIDDQHKQLIYCINELHLAVQYGTSGKSITPILTRLHDYANLHFREEELLFSALKYAAAFDHKQEHQNFMLKIQDLSKQFRYSDEFLAIHIRDLLLEWFFDHIRTRDREYQRLLVPADEHRVAAIGLAPMTRRML